MTILNNGIIKTTNGSFFRAEDICSIYLSDKGLKTFFYFDYVMENNTKMKFRVSKDGEDYDFYAMYDDDFKMTSGLHKKLLLSFKSSNDIKTEFSKTFNVVFHGYSKELGRSEITFLQKTPQTIALSQISEYKEELEDTIANLLSTYSGNTTKVSKVIKDT